MSRRARLSAPATPPAEKQALQEQIKRELRTVMSPLPKQRYARFIGRRTQIDEIFEVLRRPGSSAVLAIDGIGGVGKTALAREISQRALDDDLFVAAVWESDKPAEFTPGGIRPNAAPETAEISLDHLLDRIGSRLGYFDISAIKDTSKKKDAVAKVLRDAPYLIVVDNLDTIEGFREVVLNLGDITGQSRIILTTRISVSDLDVYSIPLKGLSLAESSEFLSSLAENRGGRVAEALRSASADFFEQVHRATDGHPLALELIAGQLSLLPGESVLRSLSEVSIRDMNQPSEGSIYTAFYRFIYGDLWKRMTRDAQKLLIFLLPYDPVEGARLDSLQASIAAREKGFAIEHALRELISLSLVRVTYEHDGTNLFLHPLTRSFFRDAFKRSR